MLFRYNVCMDLILPAGEAINRLLAATWNPQRLPPVDAIPWPEVLRLLEPGSLGPVVYRLLQGDWSSLPRQARHELEQMYYRSAEANTRCFFQLEHLGSNLHRLGKPAILLKGAALVSSLYTSIAPRAIGDIDLLVKSEDIPAYRQALTALGYSPVEVEHHHGSVLMDFNQEQFLPLAPHREMVELHWHLLDAPYYMRKVSMAWFWENTLQQEIAGHSYHVLNPEANLVYLPAHLALHHQFARLHNLFDLALLIQQHNSHLDWLKIVQSAWSFELLNALRGTLERLSQTWPDLPVAEPLRLISSIKPSPEDDRLFRLYLSPDRNNSLDFYTALSSLPDLRSKVRYVWVRLFPQKEYMIRRYRVKAGWQLPYWYIFRLFQGVFRFLRKLPEARKIARGSSKKPPG